MPGANRPDGSFQSVPASADTQNQFTLRLDHHINSRQNFSFYYYFTNDANFQPFYNFQASGANVPGFGANVGSRYQQYNPSHTWTITNSLVNEFRFTYMREGQLTFQHPQVTAAVQDSCASACRAGRLFQRHVRFVGDQRDHCRLRIPGAAGGHHDGPCQRIAPVFLSWTFPADSPSGMVGKVNLPQVGNSFMWSDNLTWVKGNHTMKFGADVRRSRFDQTLYFETSGNFMFDGSTSKFRPV